MSRFHRNPRKKKLPRWISWWLEPSSLEDPPLVKFAGVATIILMSPVWIPAYIVWRTILGIRERLMKCPPPPQDQHPLNIPREPPPPPDPELARRRELAKRTEKFSHPMSRHLYDPICDDPAFSAIIKAAAQRAQDEVGHPHVLGTCHLIWKRQKQILKDEFGIVWYSPREMNPRIIYE